MAIETRNSDYGICRNRIELTKISVEDELNMYNYASLFNLLA